MSEKFVCAYCGKEKDEDEFFDRPHGRALSCLECEERMYERLSEEVGAHIALYATCAALNVPFFPDALPPVEEFVGMEDRWVTYLDMISDRLFPGDGEVLSFFDGETNILRLFGKNLSEADTAKYMDFTMKYEATLPGTREQRERWGTRKIFQGVEMTDEVYDSLDRRYRTLAARYAGQTDPQIQENILEICKLDEARDYLMMRGNVVDAEKVMKIKDTLMASEQMRKKDEKPIEGMRMDALVVAMESKDLMDNSKFKSLPEVVRAFQERFVKSNKYDFSIDAADRIIYDVYNNARLNADKPVETVLPHDLKLTDDFGEFPKTKTTEEIKREKYVGLTPVQFEEETGE